MDEPVLTKAEITELRELARSSSLREELGLVVVEGFRAIAGAKLSGAKFDRILVEPTQSYKLKDFNPELLVEIEQKAIDRIATTPSPQGAIALCLMPSTSQNNVLETGSPIFALDNVSDPGNVGTIIRSCVAFGIKSVVTVGGCDPFHPKVVRATAGTIFATNIYTAFEYELEDLFVNRKIFAADMNGESTLSQAVQEKNAVYAFGSEAHGIKTPFFVNKATTMSIDMAELCESLNVAMTATIVAHELFRSKDS